MAYSKSPTDRRTFLKTAASGLLGSAFLIQGCASGSGQKKNSQIPFVGTQLYGWGQYYEREGKKLNDHVGEALSAIRDCGYDYAEGSVDVGDIQQNSRFAALLRDKGLKPISLYSGGRFHTSAEAEKTVEKLVAAAEVCRREGFLIFNVNPDSIGRPKTDSELQTQLRFLKMLGAELGKKEIALGIHHHTPEMQDNAKEFHYNFRNSTPELVGFCYDVHWVFRGGLTPLPVLQEYSDRIVSWHLRQSKEGIWWEDLDQGDINYTEIANFARRKNLPAFYTVELALEKGTKITRSALQNHQRSREFVRQVFKA